MSFMLRPITILYETHKNHILPAEGEALSRIESTQSSILRLYDSNPNANLRLIQMSEANPCG